MGVSKIAREAGGRWGFHALGLPCKGRTYKDSLPQLMQVAMQDTKKLMARGTTMSLDAPPAYSTYAQPAAPPPAAAAYAASAPSAPYPAAHQAFAVPATAYYPP